MTRQPKTSRCAGRAGARNWRNVSLMNLKESRVGSTSVCVNESGGRLPAAVKTGIDVPYPHFATGGGCISRRLIDIRDALACLHGRPAQAYSNEVLTAHELAEGATRW